MTVGSSDKTRTSIGATARSTVNSMMYSVTFLDAKAGGQRSAQAQAWSLSDTNMPSKIKASIVRYLQSMTQGDFRWMTFSYQVSG